MAKETIYIRILKTLVKSSKTNREILEDLDLKSFNQIGTPLTNLKDDGYIVQEFINSKSIDPKKQGPQTNTCNILKSDFNILKYLINDVYDVKNLSELMNSNYYQNLIPEIINHFNDELENQGLPLLTDLDRQNLKIYLKYSSTCLNFIFNPINYNKTFEKFEKLKKQNISESTIAGIAITKCIVGKAAFAKIMMEKMSKTQVNDAIDTLNNEVYKNYKVDMILRQFTTMDNLFNNITSPTFENDMKLAARNYIKELGQTTKNNTVKDTIKMLFDYNLM